MKKRFNVLFVSTVIFGLVLNLFGMVLVPQVASAKKNQSWHSQASKPVSATDTHLVKKIP